MRIAMVGTGYVDLVSGARFSEFGTEVISLDKDAATHRSSDVGYGRARSRPDQADGLEKAHV